MWAIQQFVSIFHVIHSVPQVTGAIYSHISVGRMPALLRVIKFLHTRHCWTPDTFKPHLLFFWRFLIGCSQAEQPRSHDRAARTAPSWCWDGVKSWPTPHLLSHKSIPGTNTGISRAVSGAVIPRCSSRHCQNLWISTIVSRRIP